MDDVNYITFQNGNGYELFLYLPALNVNLYLSVGCQSLSIREYYARYQYPFNPQIDRQKNLLSF